MNEINVRPRYYRHPKYFPQQVLKYEDLVRKEPLVFINQDERDSKKHRNGNIGMFVCNVCNTTFEQFYDSANAHHLRYNYLSNDFPRRGLKHLTCDQCNEAALTFAAKFGDGHQPVTEKNFKKLIGRGTLSLNRTDWRVTHKIKVKNNG